MNNNTRKKKIFRFNYWQYLDNYTQPKEVSIVAYTRKQAIAFFKRTYASNYLNCQLSK